MSNISSKNFAQREFHFIVFIVKTNRINFAKTKHLKFVPNYLNILELKGEGPFPALMSNMVIFWNFRKLFQMLLNTFIQLDKYSLLPKILGKNFWIILNYSTDFWNVFSTIKSIQKIFHQSKKDRKRKWFFFSEYL